MLEKDFQAKVVKQLRKMGVKCFKQKMDATTSAGTPDYICLAGPVWFFLEFKKSKGAKKRPGQQENIDWATENSFGWFIYPENYDEVMAEIKEII